MDAPLRGTVPVADLFWAKVRKGDGCWEWTATKSADGYGRFWFAGSMVGAHRLVFEWTYGPIADGLYVDHVCLNPGCVRPDHLRLTTNAENGQNRQGPYKNGTSGARGVAWHKRDKMWQAYATLNGNRAYIGRFDRKEEAEAAVTKWRQKHMPFSEMDRQKESA